MPTLRSLAISILRLDGYANIAAAYRHHARDRQRMHECDFAVSLSLASIVQGS